MSAAASNETDREAAALARVPATFRGFLEALEGRHPIEAAQALESIAAADGALAAEAWRLLEDARAKANVCPIPQGEGLPLPHPLDVEWRFSDTAAQKLLDGAVEASRAGDAILLLGVPMVVLSARRSSQDRRFEVVGEDNAVCLGLRAVVGNDPRFLHAAAGDAGAAILDPPWYPAPFIRMLIEAASRCRLGALLFVSAPPLGVRPGIARERQELFDLAQTCGLELVAIETGALGYRSPAFELSALRTVGLGALPDWRRGDLIVFRKYLSTSASITTSLEDRLPAFELTLGGVRLRLLAKGEGTAVLRPLVRDAIFGSVSARAPGRSEANFWTTANRAMTVDPLSGLKAMLALCAARGLWPKGLDLKVSEIGHGAPIDPIQPLLHELSELVDREVVETIALVGGDSWERSVSDARFLNGSFSTFLGQLAGAAA